MKKKMKRGIRKPKGYIPGDHIRNSYLARFEYLPGNEPVSGDAVQFFYDCQSFSKFMQFSLPKSGEVLQDGPLPAFVQLKSGGPNAALMKIHGLRKRHLDAKAQSLAWSICEHVLRAIQTDHGYFFSDLARLCRLEKTRPSLSLRDWLILLHWNFIEVPHHGGDQVYHFTAAELCKLAHLRGFKYGQGNDEIPIRRMHALCGELGIKVLNGRSDKSKSDFQKWHRKMQRPN